jgi:hypothetical protein
MAERKNKLQRRIDSSEIQGEGSFVVMRAPTLNDIRDNVLADLTDKKASIDFSITLLGRLVESWNWVDDEGNALPQPSEEVIVGLPYNEIKFLMDQLGIEAIADQKN